MIGAILLLTLAAPPLVPCRATDGDTLRCGRERVRLLGIDAPELPGHCRRGRQCVSGDPWASQASLAGTLDGPVRLHRRGKDVYGRTLATVEVNGRDLACHQLAAGQAQYVARYDQGGVVARRCRVADR